MSEPTRYELHAVGQAIIHVDGGWVKYADYAALQARLDETKRELSAMKYAAIAGHGSQTFGVYTAEMVRIMCERDKADADLAEARRLIQSAYTDGDSSPGWASKARAFLGKETG